MLSMNVKRLDLLQLVDTRADVRCGFLWTEGLNVSRDKKKPTTQNPNTVSQKAGKDVQKLSAPSCLLILLVQECDDRFGHSSSVKGAASLLRMRLRPSDPELEIFCIITCDCISIIGIIVALLYYIYFNSSIYRVRV